MVGKTRTKGNLRPASSARSHLSGLIPIDGLNSSIISGFADVDSIDIDLTVDPNFQIVLKKLSKKDPTTKRKALQEFTDLVKNSEVEIILTTLSSFAKIYIQLSCDVDNRVREHAQHALFSIVNKVGKNLATILKQIFPAWVASQYDTHPTAASIASNCLEKAFPAKKIQDVFIFCESEILESFTKNLTVLTAQTVCNPKIYSPEECEAKYQRVVISSLRGYGLYLEKISREKLVESSDKNLELISNDRFWNLHKSKTPQVRSAYFETLSSLLQYGPFLLKDFEEQLTSNVFKSIEETDPAILSHIWTCIILIQVNFENWFSYINIGKTLLPKLWKILRSSLYPTIIYPNLLPFVSKFNKTILPDDQLDNFYLKFFENLNFGLRNVQMGKSERSSVIAAYYESLHFIIFQIVNNDEDSQNFLLNLLDEHIIAVIFWCINNTDGSFGKQVFLHVTNLLSYWSKNCESKKVYRLLLDRFWSEIYQVLKNSLETNSNIKNIANNHVELIKQLKNSSRQPKVKSVRIIKFQDSGSSDAKMSSSETNDDLKDQGSATIAHNLDQLIFKICIIYIEKISSTLEIELVDNLEVFVKEYHSEELFRSLVKWNNPDETNICTLYDTFSTWLLKDELRCESVVEIILVLYKYLSDLEKIDLLNRWIRVPSVQSWIIMRALSYPLCMEPDITKLLKMQEVTDHLVDCARQASHGIYKDNLIILQKCFFQTEDGNILIDNKTCGEIVRIMCEPLSDASRIKQMDQCASFLAQILPVICSDNEKKLLQQKIFISLFEFSLMKDLSDDLSEDTMYEVTTAWEDALSSNDLVMDVGLLETSSTLVKQKLENSTIGKMTIVEMNKLSGIVSKLIMCSVEQESSTAKALKVENLVQKLLSHNGDKIYEAHMINLSSLVESLGGNIMSEINEESTENVNFLEALHTFLKNKTFDLEVLIKLTCNIKKKGQIRKDDQLGKSNIDENMEPGDEIEFSEYNNPIHDDEVTEDYFDPEENILKEWTSGMYEKILDVFYGETTLSILLMATSLNPDLENGIIYVQERVKLFVENLSEPILDELKERLFQAANVRGGLWTRCLMHLLNTNNYNTENGTTLLYEDSVIHSNMNESIQSYIDILKSFATCCPKILPIKTNLFENYQNLLVKVSACRSLIKNHLDGESDYNDINDRMIVGNALIVMNEILMKQKSEPYLLYNTDVSLEKPQDVLLVAEIAHFLSDALTHFPSEIDVRRWDFIRIAISSWVLSVAKSCDKFNVKHVEIFVTAVFKLNSKLFMFISTEKTKSSTELMTTIVDEWEKVFAREVNLVLIKSFIHIINNLDYESKHQEFFVTSLCPYLAFIDFSYTIQFQKVDLTFSLKDLVDFALKNLSNRYQCICYTSATILKKLTLGLVKLDQDILIQRNSDDQTGNSDDDDSIENNKWHILEIFRVTLESYQEVAQTFIEDFHFKVNELEDLSVMSTNTAFSYLLLWDCILNFCGKAPAELRSSYVRWITGHHFEEVFLVTLFKLMPREVLRNPDALIKQAMFASLEWKEIENLDAERYSAFLYAESLRTVPAVVRKWWHASNTRQAQLIEKITQNYVSPILCKQDLENLINRNQKDGKDNMQIRVLMQSREVFATYSLEEAKMELAINLPSNYPLGAIKIESLKHIAGRLQAREIVKQLSIYLTHQNGRLYDGISLWKRNLDRKYEGVEECYVCYSVINQETASLPRLTCKTCKKKFHNTCLYRWFVSSSKSTCPLCRNVF